MNHAAPESTAARRDGPRPRQWGGSSACVGLIAVVTGLLAARAGAQSVFGPNRDLATDDPANAAIVIFNENDPFSRELADYYAGKRHIPPDRLVGLHCSGDEEISREEYDAQIAGPLRRTFDERGWWKRTPDQPADASSSTVTSNRISFLVLIRGIPLRIRQTSGYAGDFSHEPSPIRDANGASVDSELTVLGYFTRVISGYIANPYYRSYSRFAAFPHPPGMMLAARLDAPTVSIVKRMIDDSVAVEKTGLWGRCYLDGRGSPPGDPMADGDAWIARLDHEIAPYALPTIYDNAPALFPTEFPMGEAAMYFGWYSEQPAGPFTRGGFHFQPGAVACHIHSYSATSVRDPFKWWVGPLLDKGADAVLGNVYEPYLGLCTHLDLFVERLFDGFTFVESAYAAQPGLSWMNTVVGDPLYRPALAWQNLDNELDSPADTSRESSPAADGRAYRQGAQIWHAKGPAAGGAALRRSAARLHSGRLYEGLGLLEAEQGDPRRAVEAFEGAAKSYGEPADKVRVAYEEVRCLAATGRKKEASAVLAAARDRFASEPAATVLEDLKSLVAP